MMVYICNCGSMNFGCPLGLNDLGKYSNCDFFLEILRLRFNMRFFLFYPHFFSQQIVMNDLNTTNTILDTFSVKYYFPHFTFLFNCSLQNQEQQIGGFATVHLSNFMTLCAKFTILNFFFFF